MKTTITLTREDGAEISFSLPSVSQSFTLSFPRGMAFNDATRDVVRQSMKAEAERVAALFNGAPALLAAAKALLASGSFAKHGEHGEKIAQEARAAIALAEGQTSATPARDTLGDTLAALHEMVIAFHGSRANPSEEKDPICRRALEQALSAMKLSGVRAP